MGGWDLINIRLSAVDLRNWNIAGFRGRAWVYERGRSGGREGPGGDLEEEDSDGEGVSLVGVARLRTKGLWWHVNRCSRALGHFTAGHGGI